MPSSLISVLARRCEDAAAPCPPTNPGELATLAEVFERLPDPRRVRGRRYRLGSLLGLCLVAVLGGAKSLAQISRFAADAPPEVRDQLGLTRATPNASTLGRMLARLDGDTVDDAVGAWLARRATDPVDEPGRLVGLAVDGKTVRGSRADGHAVHLLAAALHDSQTVIAQRQVAAKSNEISAFAPLLEHLDLRGAVVTADAMHTQREHARHIIAAGGHYHQFIEWFDRTYAEEKRVMVSRVVSIAPHANAKKACSAHGAEAGCTRLVADVVLNDGGSEHVEWAVCARWLKENSDAHAWLRRHPVEAAKLDSV
ncbi:ISAs1 family transposase [Streptomyces sp. NBC_00576]|uniref:ISAs1 family transposase n=1 Tax=Streptomyces sp. NBC_00576 TaxID=2903665 RepID=UPI002E80C15C|nr:ISAs1 family transposase [Streptomyces sp. NBC_00576]WUB74611.1 ISAs1 family transposase [Streptomyces sp. NBC_00576]